jgi:hypothetical protein
VTDRHGLTEARQYVKDGRGAGYGVGFGFVREIEKPGLDGRQFEYAITDGARDGTIHVIVSATAMVALAHEEPPVASDDELQAWVLTRLYDKAGRIHRDHDRFATLVGMSPIPLSSLEV